MYSKELVFSAELACPPAGLPAWKRLLDLALILLLSPLLLLLALGAACIVRCGSRGQVVFRQRRVGHQGKEITCYKFRTMQVDADTSAHRDYTRRLIQSQAPMIKLDAQQDPRLVPLGGASRRKPAAD